MIKLADILYFLKKAETDGSFPDRYKTYFEMQKQLIFQDTHIQTFHSFGLTGLTPEGYSGITKYADFIRFLWHNGIDTIEYQSRYEEFLNERKNNDPLARIILSNLN